MKTYCRPFKRGVSWRSQNFRDNPNNGTNGPGGHSGNDEACDIGSEVHAAGDGTVIYAGQFDDTYADNLLWLIDFGGNIIVLDCGDDEPTFIYAHLSRFLVKAGDRVSKAQVIALSGNSGTRTTGPHCHNEAVPPGYELNSPTLGRVNPDIYLTEWPEDVTGGLAAMGSIQAIPTPSPDLSREDDFLMALSQQTQAGMAENSYLNLDSNARIEAQNRAILETLGLILPAVARIDTRTAENVDIQGRIEKNQALMLDSQTAAKALAAAAASKGALNG